MSEDLLVNVAHPFSSLGQQHAQLPSIKGAIEPRSPSSIFERVSAGGQKMATTLPGTSEKLLKDLKESSEQYAKELFQTKPVSGIRAMEREIR